MPSVNIFAEMLERVRATGEALVAAGILPSGIDQSRVTVEPPRDAAHGDMSTNAAMVLAKDAGRKPRELAGTIAEKLRADVLVAKAEVAGPGFVNITLRPAAWADILRGAVRLGSAYGKINLGNGAPVGLTVAKPEVADAMKGLTISTFGGNPVTATLPFCPQIEWRCSISPIHWNC